MNGESAWSRTWVTAPDGVRLAVRVAGRDGAPTIVCVHGYPDNASLWDTVAAELTPRFRVVAYDVRGAGESDRPRAGRRHEAYHLDRLAADLAAVVDAVAPDRPVHLLAHDWGSIATWYAVAGGALRGRVSSFTSVSGPDLDHAGRWFRAQLRRPAPGRVRNALRQLLRSSYIGFFQLPLLPELAWRTGALPRYLRHVDPGAAPTRADGLCGLNLYRANMLPRLSRPAARAQRHVDVPVQVVAPAGDRFVTAPLQTELADWVPDLRVRHVPGTHWLPRAKPELVARAAAELADHVEGEPEPRSLRRTRVSPPSQGRFAGHLVVVTGAGSGIGKATAAAFGADGADVVLADIDATAVIGTADELRETGVAAFPYPVDVGDGGAMAEFAKAVRAEQGVPDIVVNNAGVGVAGSFLDTTAEDWERVVDVNLWGVIHGCREFAAQLVARGEGGHLVNVASAAAFLPSKSLSAYSATKAAVVRLSDCLRVELAGHGIGVSVVCPGMINTGIVANTTFAGADEAEQARLRKSAAHTYARRGFGPERVARDLLDAVAKDVAVRPSAPEAKAAYLLSRLTPGLLRAGARRLG